MADAIPVADAQLLAAQARSGQAGVDAYKQAQSTLTSQRNDAVQQAMQEAAMRGSPAGAMDSQAGIISTPYDQRIASLAQGQGAYEADMAARDQRYAAYEGAVNSARSLIPGQVELAVAPIRAQGEATIRNTERQGEMSVAEIEANQRLTEAKMAAAFQAAQIAAAKAAAKGGGGGSGGNKKLTKTALEGMLSQGVAAQMQGSLGDIDQLIRQRETQATGASQAVFDTAKQQAQAQQSAAVNRLPDLRQQVAGQAYRDKLQMLNTEPGDATRAAIDRRRIAPPVAPPKPNVQGLSADAAENTFMRWQQAMKQYQAQLLDYQDVMKKTATRDVVEAAPSTLGADRMASLVAQQRNAIAIAGGVKPTESAYIADTAARAPYSSTFGNISNNDLRWIAGSDPYLASLVAHSPEPLTSQNVGRLLAGTPDQYGRTDPYAQAAVQLAQQVVAQRLIDAGYEIDPADYASVTTPQMKAGETYAQFLQRLGGGKSDQEIIDAQQKQLRQGVEDQRSDITFQQGQVKFGEDQAEWAATHNPDGSPIEKPGAAPTQKEQDDANNQAWSNMILSVLPNLPSSSRYGQPYQIGQAVLDPDSDAENVKLRPEFEKAMNTILASTSYGKQGWITPSQWSSGLLPLFKGDPITANLSQYQLSLLRSMYVNEGAK